MKTIKIFAIAIFGITVGLSHDVVAQSAVGKNIKVKADPKAKYTVVNKIVRNSSGNLEIVTKRTSSYGDSYSKREVSCSNMTFRYLGDGDTIEQMKNSTPSPNMSSLVRGSSSDVISRFACANAPK
ncbi:hypothetical protein N9M10_03870 [Hellea sp.]|nr:hypothetical protein [Hellea sp.]